MKQPQAMPVDTKWFTARIKQSKYGSLRKVAQHVKGRTGNPIAPSQMSAMLRGKRGMQLFEAKQLANALGVPLSEVLERAGQKVSGEIDKLIPVNGIINSKGLAILDTSKKELVPTPDVLPPGCVAFKFQTARSELAPVDGWVVFTEEPRPYEPDMMGRLCVACPRSGSPRLGHVGRGYTRGTITISQGLVGELGSLENVELEWAAPVLLIRPTQ